MAFYVAILRLVLLFQGHNKPITVLALSPERDIIYTGSHDGFVTSWNAKTGKLTSLIFSIYRYVFVRISLFFAF